MTRIRTKPPLLSALLALVVGLFVLAPFGDAIACGPGIAEGAAADVLIDLEAGHDDADECTPSHCAHGHCHAPGSLPPQVLDATPVWSTCIRSDLPPEAVHASASPDGLIRPPRA